MNNATTITIDRDTYERFKRLADDSPIARYMRKLSIDLSKESRSEPTVIKRLEAIENILRQRENPTKSLADLIVDIRQTAQKLNYSEVRLKTLDIFLTKASPSTLEFIQKDLHHKLENPDRDIEAEAEETFRGLLEWFKINILPSLNRDQVEQMLKLIKDRTNEA